MKFKVYHYPMEGDGKSESHLQRDGDFVIRMERAGAGEPVRFSFFRMTDWGGFARINPETLFTVTVLLYGETLLGPVKVRDGLRYPAPAAGEKLEFVFERT